MIRQHFRLRFSAGALIFLATGLGACATSPATTADSLKGLTDYALVYTDGGKATPKSVSISEAADVLKTAVAPSFTEIGQLAAIAGIRTVLNYFLEKEIAKEKAELGDSMPGLPTIRH